MGGQHQDQQPGDPTLALPQPQTAQQEDDHQGVVVGAHSGGHQQQGVPQPSGQGDRDQFGANPAHQAGDQPGGDPGQPDGQQTVGCDIARQHLARERRIGTRDRVGRPQPQRVQHPTRPHGHPGTGHLPQGTVSIHIAVPGQMKIVGRFSIAFGDFGQGIAPQLGHHAPAEEIVEDVVGLASRGHGHQYGGKDQPPGHDPRQESPPMIFGRRRSGEQPHDRHVEQGQPQIEGQVEGEGGGVGWGQQGPGGPGDGQAGAKGVAPGQQPVERRRADPDPGQPSQTALPRSGGDHRLHLLPQCWHGHGAGPSLSTAERRSV